MAKAKVMQTCSLCFGRGYRPKYRANGKPGFIAITCRGCGGRGERLEKER